MKSLHVSMISGHTTGIKKRYYIPNDVVVLEDYMTHAAGALTISDEHRLKKQVAKLETERDQEIARLEAHIDTMKEENRSQVLTLKAQFEKINEKLNRIDLVDLQSVPLDNFPSDYTIQNLLSEYGIDGKQQQELKSKNKKND